MLITILLSVCLHADAATCRKETIDFMGGAMACVITAQPVVAEWSDRNPEWKVISWTCKAG